MSTTHFAQQIEFLLWTGAIEGDEILSLYHLLKCYEQGGISAQEMQAAIDVFNPDLFLEPWLGNDEDSSLSL